MTVITVGSKYEVYVRSPASSHRQILKQPFQTLAIKWEVNIFEKKSSCVFLPASLSCVFLPASLSLCRCRWLYNNITPHGPDDGSVEPKRHSVDFTSHWIYPSTWIVWLSIFLYILSDFNPLFTSISYIYMCVCVFACVCLCVHV